MGSSIQPLLRAGTLVLAALVVVPFAPPGDAAGDEKPARAANTDARTVSYLREVRPILAQHCFRCHGPDEAARKGKLRLDLKDAAFAARAGKHVIVPGRLADSLVWERITNPDDGERMPPVGSTEPLTAKQIATLKA